jgi:hypothetical protein
VVECERHVPSVTPAARRANAGERGRPAGRRPPGTW